MFLIGFITGSFFGGLIMTFVISAIKINSRES